jgi:hypothetical protein
MKQVLFTLTAVLTFISLVGGIFMVADPSGKLISLTSDFLRPTPFSDFFIPGVLLLLIVTVPGVLSLYLQITDDERKMDYSLIFGVVTTMWVLFQVITTRSIHWQDFVLFATGLLIVLLSVQLSGKWMA